MTLRFYSNETEDTRPIATIEDIDNNFGIQIDRILLMGLDTSISFKDEELVLIGYSGIAEVRMICNNIFIASTPKDKFLTTKFFREAFGFDYSEDLDKWLPQIKKVAEELNKIPRGQDSYWYYRT